MQNEQAAYGVLILIAILLMVIGIQGNLGVTLAIVFNPSEVTINSSSTSTTSTTSSTGSTTSGN